MENEYRYCLACKVRYKNTGEPNQVCKKCGGKLSDTATADKPASQNTAPAQTGGVGKRIGVGAGQQKPAPKPVETPKPTTVNKPSTIDVPKAAEGEMAGGASGGGIMMCLLFNVLSGMPIIGLVVGLISLFTGWMSKHMSKSMKIAIVIANAVGLLIFILLGWEALMDVLGLASSAAVDTAAVQ